MDLITLRSIITIILFILFMLLVWFVYGRKNKKHYEKIGNSLLHLGDERSDKIKSVNTQVKNDE